MSTAPTSIPQPSSGSPQPVVDSRFISYYSALWLKRKTLLAIYKNILLSANLNVYKFNNHSHIHTHSRIHTQHTASKLETNTNKTCTSIATTTIRSSYY